MYWKRWIWSCVQRRTLIAGKLTAVAVKRLNDRLGQGLKEFLTEIQLLTSQEHPNLVSLLGYCDEGAEKIIIYEYAERGSLNRCLQDDREHRPSMDVVKKELEEILKIEKLDVHV
ncbi:probable receptor-like protein kinase At5g18500 [Helianthus annuus]|uniref:probable receptor-like protein kinase At5g18500 n=1 Tax=Helianthus annuus TaxID=4232 RepID=UPI0016530081|nr:probable receptor-like protein kinase At5g18500 [Helianthus annuus]